MLRGPRSVLERAVDSISHPDRCRAVQKGAPGDVRSYAVEVEREHVRERVVTCELGPTVSPIGHASAGDQVDKTVRQGVCDREYAPQTQFVDEESASSVRR